MANEQTCVYKQPNSLRGDRWKRNQNKYCWYHKDVSHTTEECVMLKDEIEKLIRNGYLWDYIHGGRAKPRNDQNDVEPPHEIRTNFSRLYFARETQGVRDCYVREAKDR